MASLSTVSGSESAEVEEHLARGFASPFRVFGVLVIRHLSIDPSSDRSRSLMRRIAQPIARQPGVLAVVSPGTQLDPLLVGDDGKSALMVVGLDSSTPHLTDSLRALALVIASQIRQEHPDVTFRWTGRVFLEEDLRRAGALGTRRAELLALPLTILVLRWAFGSWSVLLRAAVAVMATLGAGAAVVSGLSRVLVLSPLGRTAIAVVGVALALDYVLLLSRGSLPTVQARRAVWLAAIAVAIGYTGLALAPTGELRSAGMGGAVMALVAAFSAIRLAPAPRAIRRRRPDRWRIWGHFVVRHPLLILGISLPPLLVLAGAARMIRLNTPLDGWLPARAESTLALADLDRMGRGGAVGMLRVLLILPTGMNILEEPGWAALGTTGRHLRATPGVGEVRSLATLGTGHLVVAREVMPEVVRNVYLSRDGRHAVLDVLPDRGVPRDSLRDLVGRLRQADPETLTGVSGARVLVGGLPAHVLDYEVATRRILPVVIGVITLATFLVLVVAYRAPVLALKAVVLNLLVVAAAVGVTTLVFQEGLGVSLFGHTPLGSVLPTVPLLGFALAFGLSMDYEVFLLAALQNARAGQATSGESIAEAVALSGPVITRAGIIMAVLFLAVAASDLMPLAMVGMVMMVAVLLDITVVRMAVAPALLRLAGQWNWWPDRSRFRA